MDTTAINHISLCSGYGGIDLGLSRAMGRSLRTIAYSEIEAFACANLVSKVEAGLLDPAPIWSDLKSFPWEKFRGLVDIISGGYPCQPFSAAGKRAGKDDPRHLWPWIADGIAVCRPRLCFFENVEGHVTLGLRDVIEDLGQMGYRTTWGIFSAAEVGAPHQRKRVFILAYADGFRMSGSGNELAIPCQQGQGRTDTASHCNPIAWPSGLGEPQHGWEPPRTVGNAADADDKARQSSRNKCGSSPIRHDDNEEGQGEYRGTGGNSGWDAECQVEPTLGGNPHGNPHRLDDAELYVTCDNRTDELRLLGNGVVPATAERAFLTLLSELTS